MTPDGVLISLRKLDFITITNEDQLRAMKAHICTLLAVRCAIDVYNIHG